MKGKKKKGRISSFLLNVKLLNDVHKERKKKREGKELVV